MDSCVKILGTVVALCAAFATGPGLAQEDSPTTGRDVPRAVGGADDAVAVKGLVTHTSPDQSRTGPPSPPAAQGSEAAAATRSSIEPVRPEGGSAGLRRRANIKALIANAPKMATGSPASNTRIGLPLARSGAEGGTARNAIGAVVTGGGQGLGHAVPGSIASAGIGVHSPGRGVVGVGAAPANAGRADAPALAIPPNQAASPLTHTSGINGTLMGHIASGPSYIGGPAKDRSGINGTAMRPKH
jgi:hypothetical protein